MEQKSDSEAFIALRNTIDDVFLEPVQEEMGRLVAKTVDVSDKLEKLTHKYANLRSDVEGLEKSTKTGSREIYALVEDALYKEDHTTVDESLVERNADHLKDLSSDLKKLAELLETIRDEHKSRIGDLVNRVETNQSAIDDWSDESREIQEKHLEEVATQTDHLTDKLEEKTSALVEESRDLQRQLEAIKEQTASNSNEIASTLDELQNQQRHQRKLVLGLYVLVAIVGIAGTVGLAAA